MKTLDTPDVDRIINTLCAYFALTELLITAVEKADVLPNSEDFMCGLQMLALPLTENCKEIIKGF